MEHISGKLKAWHQWKLTTFLLHHSCLGKNVRSTQHVANYNERYTLKVPITESWDRIQIIIKDTLSSAFSVTPDVQLPLVLISLSCLSPLPAFSQHHKRLP
jgi:hypothetical protein